MRGSAGKSVPSVAIEFADLLAHPRVAKSGLRLGGELAPQSGEQFGIADVLHFREAGQLDGLAADLLLHALEAAGDAEAAGAFEHGIDQGEELEREIIAGGQLMIGGGGLAGGGEAGREMTLELLQQLPMVKLLLGERSVGAGNGLGHALSKPERVAMYKLQRGDNAVSIR